MIYFLLIRPAKKSAEQAKNFRDSLKSGDRVITAGGVYGKIAKVEAETVLLEIAPKTQIKVVRTQVVERQGSENATTEESTKSTEKDKDKAKRT